MRRALCVGVILLLALVVLPGELQAQQPGSPGSPPGSRGDKVTRLRQNYPNPFNPTTTIPFVLLEEDFERTGTAVVTIRIYNVLQQPVAIPVALDHPAGGNQKVENLAFTTPGEQRAFWDGLDRNGQKVASGIYYMQLIVNGKPAALRKMLVGK